MSTLRSSVSAEQVLLGYHHGLFPMSRGRYGSIEWFTAEPRTVIPLDSRFRVPRTVRRLMRRVHYDVSFDQDFASVIEACARHQDVRDDEVWLSDQMIELYSELHQLGYAHSIEVTIEGHLVGGLYGVALHGAFFGESMFSRVKSASQFALVALVERLQLQRYILLDAQMRTPHIARYGAIDLTHDEYLILLEDALACERSFRPQTSDIMGENPGTGPGRKE